MQSQTNALDPAAVSLPLPPVEEARRMAVAKAALDRELPGAFRDSLAETLFLQRLVRAIRYPTPRIQDR